MAGKEVPFKKDQRVRASAAALACPDKSGKLMARTGLDKEQLQQPMEILSTDGNQLELKHKRLSQPFTAHAKFFEPATA